MALQLQTFNSYVQLWAAAAQSAASVTLDFTEGSVIRAFAEADSAQALWLQWNALLVLQAARLQTSVGTDVDTFIGDFGLARLPGTPASGTVTFSRFTAATQATITPGAHVKTGDGSQTYTVIADDGQSAWNPALNAYVMPVGVYSANATVIGATPSSSGNAGPATISQLASAIPGVDTVTNPIAFGNGSDPETDAALKRRFQLFIASLSKATPAAVESATAGVQDNLNYAVVENSPSPGTFIVVVDDGTGSPPNSLLQNVFAAVDAVRPVGSSFSVVAPTVVPVTITAAIQVSPGVYKNSIIGALETAVEDFVNGLSIGATLPYTRLAQVIYDAAPGQIANVIGLTINGSTSDITPGVAGAVKTTSVTFS